MYKVFLVDDERFAIEGLISMLDWARFEGELVGTASSGEEALSLLEHIHPDVIISDIKMEGMNGIRLAQLVHDKLPDLPFILLTAHGEFEYARQALKYGVIDYILKPITREKLEQLNQLLTQKAEQMNMNRRSYLTIRDGYMEKQLMTALKKGDRSTLDDFFQSHLFSDLMNSSNCNPVGIQLINYLYLYLGDLNLDQKAIIYSKNKTMETFLDLSSYQEKADYLITKYYDLLSNISQQKSEHADAIASFALRYIDTHYTDPEFNLSSLSYAMHISLSHLSTVFKQATGKNLSTYVSELRMEHAQRLLSDPSYSISEISTRSGYSDSKYFAKLFKKKTGNTPSEYRNLIFRRNLS